MKVLVLVLALVSATACTSKPTRENREVSRVRTEPAPAPVAPVIVDDGGTSSGVSLGSGSSGRGH